MFLFRRNDDPLNPLVRAYRRVLGKLRNLLIVLAAVCVMCVFFGVPSVQYTYSAYPTRGTPTAQDKVWADYWNPLSGWQRVEAGELAPGCPMFVFMPLHRCVDLKPYRNSFSVFIFGEEFFDGP